MVNVYLIAVALYANSNEERNRHIQHVYYSMAARDKVEAMLSAVARMYKDYPECTNYAVGEIKEF